MGALLDLEDVAAGHPKAQKELAELYAFRDAIQGKSMIPEKSLGEIVAGSGSALARDQLAELRKDAKRYRWLRIGKVPYAELKSLLNDTPDGIDRTVDKLMNKSRVLDAQSS